MVRIPSGMRQSIRHPTPYLPEANGGSTWVRHDRGGVDVDSFMQTSEDASAVSCELDHFTNSTVQGAEPVDVTSDVLAGKVSWHKVYARVSASSASCSWPSCPDGPRPQCILHGGRRA